MAVNSIPYNSRLILRVQVGAQQGNPVVRSRSFNNIKPTADDSSVFAIAQKLASLQKYPLVKIIRTNDEELVEM
ncbi:MAG: DUF1659 domain-containing protein [Dictyoglomaceae bacterium]